MHLRTTAVVPAEGERAFAELADLAGYPDWLTIVVSARSAEPHPDDPGPAWAVDLGARLGPLRRTKSVRMVRTVYDPPRHVRFERLEHDGENHSDWILDATIAERPEIVESEVVVALDYSGGSLPLIDVLLRQEAARAGHRLAARMARSAGR